MKKFFQCSDGSWVCLESRPQCQKLCFCDSKYRCQGIEGHEGNHWSYDESGRYYYSVNPEPVDPDGIAEGDVAPGHKDYVSPETTFASSYFSKVRSIPVYDPVEIARLTRIVAGEEELQDGEVIDHPISNHAFVSLVQTRQR